MIVLIISRLKRKILFAFRLCLLVIILTILAIQIYGMFKTGAHPPLADPVTAVTPEARGLLENVIEWLREYYRGNLR